MVYPQLVDGLPDLNMGVQLDECSEEWLSSLSKKDSVKVEIAGYQTF
jgi:hypothetical protein